MEQRNFISTLSYAERLNTLHRLRLLRNTTGELSAHTGIQLRNNSFNRKAPFIARSMYSEFCREARERTGIELDELLTHYAAASRRYEKIVRTRRAQPEFHRGVLRCLLDAGFAGSQAAAPYRRAAGELDENEAALLTLLVLEILPPFAARPGDVDADTLAEHLIRLRDFLRELYADTPLMRFAPFLTREYRLCINRLRQGELFTRLDLVRFTCEVLGNLKNNYDPEQLLKANLYVNERKIHPALEQGLWVERDRCGGSAVCWRFEELGMDYLLIRSAFEPGKKNIVERRYELSLYREEDEGAEERTIFSLMLQSETEHYCQGQPIPERAYMRGELRLDDEKAPAAMEWVFFTNRYDGFPDALLHTDLTMSDFCSREKADESWSVFCETGEYEYLDTERAFAGSCVYVECSRTQTEDGGFRVDTWYRIPQRELPELTALRTPLARIRHDGRTYLCFIPQNRVFDVTTEESRRANGIRLVKRIEVRYAPGDGQ